MARLSPILQPEHVHPDIEVTRDGNDLDIHAIFENGDAVLLAFISGGEFEPAFLTEESREKLNRYLKFDKAGRIKLGGAWNSYS